MYKRKLHLYQLCDCIWVKSGENERLILTSHSALRLIRCRWDTRGVHCVCVICHDHVIIDDDNVNIELKVQGLQQIYSLVINEHFNIH